MEAAPACFSIQRNHHQGVYACTVHNTHVTQAILCRHSTDNICTTSISTLNQAYNFSKVLAVAP